MRNVFYTEVEKIRPVFSTVTHKSASMTSREVAIRRHNVIQGDKNPRTAVIHEKRTAISRYSDVFQLKAVNYKVARGVVKQAFREYCVLYRMAVAVEISAKLRLLGTDAFKFIAFKVYQELRSDDRVYREARIALQPLIPDLHYSNP